MSYTDVRDRIILPAHVSAAILLIAFPEVVDVFIQESMGPKWASDSSIIKYSVTDMELKRSTLSPGESVQGFVYFQVSDHITEQSMQTDVLIRLKRLGADALLEYKIAIELQE